jgi:iron-sulfur cluster repair protein YtfE (RIC family)
MPTKIRSQKATAQLREDHRKVKRLFADFDRCEEGEESRMKELFEEIKAELQVHTQIEEEIFYPAMQGSEDEDVKETVLEAHEEHKVAKTLLAELSELSPEDETFCAKMYVLSENVKHHIEEEEGDLFPSFDELPREEQEEIAERLRARKAELQAGG